MLDFEFLLSRWSGQQLSLCLSFPMQPVTEQILAWPYQHRPQRAEGEVEQKQLLGDTANDGPH